MLPAAADKTWGDPSSDGIGDGGSKSASRNHGGSVAADADGRTGFVIRSVTSAGNGGLLCIFGTKRCARSVTLVDLHSSLVGEKGDK